MKPTPALCNRIRFSTKDVGKGFYRGNRTGSTGAHTPYGGYIIDYRKVRNFRVPDLKDFKLTPWVTREINEQESPPEEYDWVEEYQKANTGGVSAHDPNAVRRERAMKFLNEWRLQNPQQFEEYVDHQEAAIRESLEMESQGVVIEAFDRFRAAELARLKQQEVRQ